MTLIINAEELLSLANAAVKDRGPDWSYPAEWRDDHADQCTYGINDEYGSIQPACIVGHILWQIDPVILNWTHYHKEGSMADNVLRQLSLESRFDVVFDEDAIKAASVMQRMQDEDHTWSEAVRYAVENLTK